MSTSMSRQQLLEFGEFLRDVIIAGSSESSRTERLDAIRRVEQRTASGASEAVPADGGFLMQPDWANTIVERAYQESAVLKRCNEWRITSNGIKIPMIDELSRKDGSRFGGARGYWLNEADTITSSKGKFRNLELEPKKIAVLAYGTNELMNDVGVLAKFVIGAWSKELAFRIVDAIIAGDGAAKPQGLMNSGALISVTRSSGNVVAANDVLGMLERFWVGSRTDPDGFIRDGNLGDGPKPVWLCHSNVVTQLATCVISVGTGGSLAFLYNPETANLMGYPVIPVEQCQDLGTQGDIILVDLNEYQLAFREQNRLDVSMHINFTTDEQALRLITRVDGQLAWSAPVTTLNGSKTQSPVVVLHA